MKKALSFVLAVSLLLALFSTLNTFASDYIICVDYNAGMYADGNLCFFNNEHKNENPGNISSYGVSYSMLFGWFGSNLASNYKFGYSINGGEIVLNDGFATNYETAVKNAIDGSVPNATFYSRYHILAPLVCGKNVHVEYYAVPQGTEGAETIMLGNTVYTNPSPTIDKADFKVNINGNEKNVVVRNSVEISENIIKFEEYTKLEIDKSISEFNEISINYTLTTPVMAKMEYLVSEETVTDTVILPVSQNGSVSQMIGCYLEEKKATKINSLYFENLGDGICELSINSINAKTSSFPKEKKVTLENKNIKATINIAAGGELSYFSKSGEENLISGSSGDAQLISAEYGENYVYVKAIPAETTVIREIRYVLYEDYLEVSEKLQYSNPKECESGVQDIMSFSTISSLDTFEYYPGENSWQGGGLKKVNPLLNLLSDYAECVHSTNYEMSGNTETWGALVNGNTSRGLGVYLPNTESFYVGTDGSSSHLEISVMRSVNDNSMSYTYILAAGEVENMRNIFKSLKDTISQEFINQSDFVPPVIATPVPENTEAPATPVPQETPIPSENPEDTYSFTGNWGITIIILICCSAVVIALCLLSNKKHKD